MYLLAQEAQYDFAAGGKYGFLPQHATLPPFSQWGYDSVPGVWESDTEPFADASITTVMITAGNFIQWQGPEIEYPGDPGISPLSATKDVVDWVHQQGDDISIYIYENWPDMAGFLQNGFPPSEAEFANYHDETLGAFHDWWIVYHDSLLLVRPELNVRMIPIGPILSKLLTEPALGLDDIPITELYEDDAPHGRPSIYFLSALISYMAIYEEKAPSTYIVPQIIHENIRMKYSDIVDFMWTELHAFNLPNGDSRVFRNSLTDAADLVLENDGILLYPNPTDGLFRIKGQLSDYDIHLLDSGGNIHEELNAVSDEIVIDIQTLPTGLYFIRTVHKLNGVLGLEKILKVN